MQNIFDELPEDNEVKEEVFTSGRDFADEQPEPETIVVTENFE